MICAGIDAGSRTIKAVLFDHAQAKVVGSGIINQGIDQPRLAGELYDRTLREAGLEPARIHAVIATGYGRNRVSFARGTITEISCHARGIHYLMPSTRTIIEIGGQDSKVIFLDDRGRVRDFAMNDRCAAGTGQFLEMVASRLGVALPQLGDLSRGSPNPAVISSTCVVFADTEIIGLLAQGVPPTDIAAGVQNAMATRVASMAGRTLIPPVCFTGGVALQTGMIRALETALDLPLAVAPHPQFSGALGAALLAPAESGLS